MTVPDLRQHVEQHLEIAGLYTFQQSMSLLVYWVLHQGKEFLA